MDEERETELDLFVSAFVVALCALLAGAALIWALWETLK